MAETNIGSNEQRGSEMPTERGSNPRLSLDALHSLVRCQIDFCGAVATHDRDNIFKGGLRVPMCARCAEDAANVGHTGIRELPPNVEWNEKHAPNAGSRRREEG